MTTYRNGASWFRSQLAPPKQEEFVMGIWKYYNKATDTYIPLVPNGGYDEVVFNINRQMCKDNGNMIVIFHASGGTYIEEEGILANRDLSMSNRSGYRNRREAALRKENERRQAAVKRAADTHTRLAESLETSEIAWSDNDSDLLLTYN
tara:strand:+ start:300 stop:746 length:447 start_codon:yes stop_codon:yes gene_type:complete